MLAARSVFSYLGCTRSAKMFVLWFNFEHPPSEAPVIKQFRIKSVQSPIEAVRFEEVGNPIVESFLDSDEGRRAVGALVHGNCVNHVDDATARRSKNT